MARKKRTPPVGDAGPDRLRGAAIALLALLLLWCPFPEGAYPESWQFVAFWHAGLALAGAFALGIAERRPLRVTPARLAALALWLAYVLSLTVAVVPRQAVQEVFKFGLFLMVFVAVSEMVRSVEEKARPGEEKLRPQVLFFILWASAVVFSLTSLLAAVGLLPFDVVTSSRLFTFLGYPNPAGSLSGAAFLVGLALRRNRLPGTPVGDVILSAGQWALLTILFLTVSRGAWVVFPVALAALLLAWPRGERLAPVGDLAATGISVVAVAPFIPAFYGTPGPGTALIGAGLLAAVLLGWLSRRYQALRPRLQAAVAGTAVAAVLLIGGALLVTGTMPGVISGRLAGISLAEKSAVERIIWTADAFEIVKDYPVLGAGGGAWSSLYFQYQDYPYTTREVHNDFMEVWVSAGTLGFLSLLALLGATAWAAVRLLRSRRWGEEPARRALVAGLAGAVLMVALHSALDFNLSLAYMGVLLWGLMGVIDGLSVSEAAAGSEFKTETVRKTGGRTRPGRGRAKSGHYLWPRLVAISVVFCLAMVSFSLFGAIRVMRSVERLPQTHLANAEAALKQACSLDPWSKQLRVNLALVQEALYEATGRQEYLEASFEQASRAVILDRFSPSTRAFHASLAERHGRLDLALSEYEEALRLHPCEPRRYEVLAEFRLKRAQDALRSGDASGAREELESILALRDELSSRSAAVPPHAPPYAQIPALTPNLALRSGQALLLLGRDGEAQELLEAAHTAGRMAAAGETADGAGARKAEAALWLSLAARSAGDHLEAARYLELARSGIPTAEQALEALFELLGRI